MRYPTHYKAHTRERILGAAGRLFRSRGYAASGVAQVMKAVGLTVGGFYNHFASKDALLAATLARGVAQTRALLLTGLDEVKGPVRVYEILRRYLSRPHRDQVAAGCALPSLAAEVPRQGNTARQAFDAHFGRLIDDLRVGMPPGPGAGMTPEDRVLATLALAVGALMLARSVSDRRLSDRILWASRRLAVPELDAHGNPPCPKEPS